MARSGDRAALASVRGRSLGLAMSTRKLIFAALLCGLAILVAFTVQVMTIR